MEIKKNNNNIVITGMRDFDLRHIFECGQCFRFETEKCGEYTGTAFGCTVRISQCDDAVTFYDVSEKDFYGVWYDYFDLGRDYGAIKQRLCGDKEAARAVEYGGGIRILNQDLWETMVSFIISASNNIPRIKGIIERLCRNFGAAHTYEGRTYFSFPSADTLAKLDVKDLSVIRAGFRDKYIIDAARRFSAGEFSRDKLLKLDTIDAKKALMSVKGIGSKVADCILLFGLHRTDAYPVDVWIKRITEYCYFGGEERTREEISEFAVKKFGSLCGYAQQYLFFYARENKIGLD